MTRSGVLKVAAVVAVVLVAGYFGRGYVVAEQQAPQLLTAPAVLKDLEQTVIATGTLEALKQVSVGAQVSGQIKSLKVDFGDQVKVGDLIAEIDSKTQENDLKNAQAALANVTAQRAARAAALKQAELAFQRQKRTLSLNASSREDYEAAEATLAATRAEIDALDAQIEQAEIQVATAQVDLGYTRITAPIDGTVVAVVVKEGQTVNSNQSAPTIVKVAQLDVMTVKAEISEADVVKVKAGQPVYFTILGQPDKAYHATLRMIEPAPTSINTDSGSGSSASSNTSSSTATAIYYNGIFDVPNPDGLLRISMTAQVSIVLASAKDAVTIPTSALGPANPDGSYTVNVLGDNGQVSARMIRLGLEDTVDAQVLEGLSVGEKVVLGDPAAGSSFQMRGPRMGL